MPHSNIFYLASEISINRLASVTQFYIIPLAKKLKDCGVFGVSSDEFLDYALQNKIEWEERGQEVVAEMTEKMQRRYPK